jgi:hypothetical protein
VVVPEDHPHYIYNGIRADAVARVQRRGAEAATTPLA